MDIPEQSGPEYEFAHIIIQTIQKKLEQKESGGIGFRDAILPVFREVLEFSQGIVLELEDSGQSPGVACRSGCSYCCHSQVNIIPIEALLISAFIKTDFSPDQVSALNAGISRTRSLTAGKTINQIYALKEDLPCVFLTAGKCSVYTMRPSICRSWNSFDAGACRTAYDSPDASSSVGASPARNFVFGTTRELFQRLSVSLSLQSGTLLLHNAMFDCLNDSDSLEHWAGGDDVFKYA